MSKIMDLVNHKRIIREDREYHVCIMNELIDQLKDENVPKETREELANSAKGMLATNAILEETNCNLMQMVGRFKGVLNTVALGVIGYGIGAAIGHFITKRER